MRPRVRSRWLVLALLVAAALVSALAGDFDVGRDAVVQAGTPVEYGL